MITVYIVCVASRAEGIPTAVDLNRCYKDYPAIIWDAGLNRWVKQSEPDYKALYLAEKEKIKRR